jgi:IS30 family transposase
VFWRLVREGLTTEAAAAGAGIGENTAFVHFRQAGGMAPFDLAEPSGRYLSFAERETIMVMRAQGRSVRAIAGELGRAPSTISREIAVNGSRTQPYRASTAHASAERSLRRPKATKLAGNDRLRDQVQAWLLERYSPQQIAARLVLEFPDDPEMRVSHETIYRALFVQGRGELRRELTACLRTGRAVRKPRARAGQRREVIKDKVMISERPAEAADRAVPGHWEGDLIVGTGHRSAIGTLVERSTRFVMLLHLPGRHGAEEVRDAMTAAIERMPAALRGSLTWDQGVEMARHREITVETGLPIYFCDPASPWQRGTNENTNGLLRQYFPKGTSLAKFSAEDLEFVADQLNRRPRQTLGWKNPAEALAELLSTPQTDDGVATAP